MFLKQLKISNRHQFNNNNRDLKHNNSNYSYSSNNNNYLNNKDPSKDKCQQIDLEIITLIYRAGNKETIILINNNNNKIQKILINNNHPNRKFKTALKFKAPNRQTNKNREFFSLRMHFLIKASIIIINNIIKISNSNSSSSNNNKEGETSTVKLIILMISIHNIKEMRHMIIFRDKMSGFKLLIT